MKTPIYITGHRHPDTDSIASAIGYAFYKRSMGEYCIPCRLGEINKETKYLLDRFAFEVPMLLEDARNTLGEIELDPPFQIHENATIHDAVERMKQTNCPSLAVHDDQGHVKGIVSRSDLAALSLADTSDAIELIQETSCQDICKTVNGKLIYEAERPHVNGKISMIALSSRKLENYEVQDRIVIVGNDPEAMIELMERKAGMVIAVWTDHIAEEVIDKAKQCQCSLIISGHGAMNTSRYIYFAPKISLIMKKDIVMFHTNEIVESVGKKLMRTRFRQYPVLDSEEKLAGYVSRYIVMNHVNKKLILVDHNEFSQSVNAIEKAEVLEVLDHHRINDFVTSRPVSFRCEIVGSTATIVATMFRENQIPMPANLAGLLLGAILSDTMNLHSPTTTPRDHATAHILCALADLDLEQFGKDMFEAQSADVSGSLLSLINKDIKLFELPNRKVMISQILIKTTAEILQRQKEMEEICEEFAFGHGLDMLLVVFTSIAENGSVMFYGGKDDEFIDEVLSQEEKNHGFCEGLLSRKLQILPKVLDAVTK